MAHRNIPIFIPHLGCPHKCVFCDQHSISGCRRVDVSSVSSQIDSALQTIPEGTEVEIAYFGGSFTGIDRELMQQLLKIAASYVASGAVQSIRVSTRPDMIDGKILEILKKHHVKTVELGLQSMDDRVLEASFRGHTAKQAEDACRAVKQAGFSLVGQMMVGLPCSDLQSELATAEQICKLGADACRIYPTVVFAGTPLATMTEKGRYQPLTTEDAVKRSAEVLRIFLSNGIPCLRIGLCASEELVSEETAIAGAKHPALGELVWNEICYQNLYTLLENNELLGEDVVLTVAKNEISKTVGQKRCNLKRLQQESGTNIIKIHEAEIGHPMTAAKQIKNEGEHQPCI